MYTSIIVMVCTTTTPLVVVVYNNIIVYTDDCQQNNITSVFVVVPPQRGMEDSCFKIICEGALQAGSNDGCTLLHTPHHRGNLFHFLLLCFHLNFTC